MDDAPDEKIPALTAVPQPAYRHGQHQIDIGARLTAAISAQQGNIQIVAQPGRQGHMPATPEILYGDRNVGIIEVRLKLEAQHQPQADCHQAVAGEIEIELYRVSAAACPGVDQTGIFFLEDQRD